MRILLVEDDSRLADVIARGLRKQAFAVDIAPDGEEAVFMAETSIYDLILLDVMLPRRDGFEVCRSLRGNGAQTPILMLTARDAVADRVAGLDQGADDYLVKPFDFAELLARIRALLRRRHPYRGVRLTVADLTLDTSTRLAERGGRQIALTAKEYAMLEYLMENAGRVLTRTEIAEHVWDVNYDPFSNLIDVYIRRLRQKVDSGNGLRLIRTRRGAGYLMSADEAEPSEDEV